MITASQVKELREKTGAGMMDCKKALTECDGDINKAIDWLREKGIAKAAKKGSRIAAEGLSRVKTNGNVGIVFEMNSETDFVAKNDQFVELLNAVEDALLANKPADMDAAMAMDVNGETLETAVANATATIGEKITFRRFAVVEKSEDETFGSYMHMGGKISALAVLKGGNAETAKDIAMQVASMAPQYVTRNDMPQEAVEHERAVQVEILKNDESLKDKPEKVLQGIIEGRISKQLQDLCLVDQIFFNNTELKVKQFLKEEGAEMLSFTRFVVGEGIEKREENFAEEVAAQIAK